MRPIAILTRTALALCVVALLGVFAAGARADVVHLKDGRKIEGKILEETSTVVVIETRFGGQRRIEQDRILRIERKRTAKEEYDSKRKRTNTDDPEAMFELGNWCQEKGLRMESLMAYRAVIKLDSDHPGARKALDYVRKDGRWIRAKDLEKVEADPEPTRPATSGLGAGITLGVGFLEDAGFSEYNGEWITSKERKRIKDGLNPYAGRFYSSKDIERMKQGEVMVDGSWMSYEEADAKHSTWDTAWKLNSLHYEVQSDWPRREVDNLLKLLEKNYREYARVIGGPPQKTPLRVYAFRTKADYLEFLTANKLDKFARSDAFFDARTGLVVAHSGKNFGLVSRIIGGVASWQYFKYSYDSAMPGWLSEGISIYFRRFGFDPDGTYVRAKPDRGRLKDIVEALETDNIIPIKDLIRLEMWEANDRGLITTFSAQSWALMQYLQASADESTRRQFLRYMDRLRTTFFVMGNAEFIAADFMEEIFTPSGLLAVEKGYLEMARQMAIEEGIIKGDAASVSDGSAAGDDNR